MRTMTKCALVSGIVFFTAIVCAIDVMARPTDYIAWVTAGAITMLLIWAYDGAAFIHSYVMQQIKADIALAELKNKDDKNDLN